MLTVRGQTATEFTANLQAVRGLLATPQPSAQPTQEPREGWCTRHELQMKFHPGKNGRPGWWSHKTAEGQWCKGK
jgi:hypothetical protein